MYIFLGIILELATIIGSFAITINAGINGVLEISKHGYKIDKRVLDEYERKRTEEKKSKGSGKVLGTILLLIPGINLISASIRGLKLKKTVMNDPEVKAALVPMTDEEKEQYKEMKTKMQKLSFTAFTAGKEEEEEFFGFIGNKTIIIDHGLTALHYDELLPLDYTLDEVKKLNEATTYSYRLGKVENKNVAIISIPNPNSPFSRLQFKSEEFKKTHTYEQMTEEEAQDKTFIVYPFIISEDTKEKVNNVIEEIKQDRHNNILKAQNTLQTQSNFIIDDTLVGPDENKISEQHGPVLKKTLGQRK